MVQMGTARLIALSSLMIALACGGGSSEGSTTPSSDDALPWDRVELLARTERPDAVHRELSYLENDYADAPGTPTSHVQARLRPNADPTPIASRFEASVRSVPQGWHLFVFSDVAAAKRAMPSILCDPNVIEAAIALEPALH